MGLLSVLVMLKPREKEGRPAYNQKVTVLFAVYGRKNRDVVLMNYRVPYA